MAGALLLIAVAIIGWRIYSQRKTTQASAALDDAMKTYQARIRTAAEPVTDPNEVTYTDEKNKYSDAAKKFDGIVASFGRTKPGLQARYYAAICDQQLAGKYDIAEQDLNAVENSGDNDLALLAKFQHAGLYATTGKTQPAIDSLQPVDPQQPQRAGAEAGGDALARGIVWAHESARSDEATQPDQGGVSEYSSGGSGAEAAGIAASATAVVEIRNNNLQLTWHRITR